MDFENFTKNTKKEYLFLAIFAFFVVLLYGNTLRNGFVHDDIAVIVENPFVHSLNYLPKVITGCIWEYSFKGCEGTTYYRPIQTLSYLLSWQITQSPWFFHLLNILYFLAAVFLVFILSKLLTKNFLISFLAALIFLFHPVNSEVVNWISGVPELTYTVFILLSTIFFIKYRQESKIQKLVLAAIFYFLGMISKEPAALLPIIFVFLDIFFFNISIKEFLKTKQIKTYIILVIPAITYLVMRKLVLGRIGEVGAYYYGDFSLPERIYTFFVLLSGYLFKLIKPFPLIFSHTFIKKADFSSFVFIGSLIAVLIYLSVFIISLIKKKIHLAFAFLWIFVFIFPVLIFLNSQAENIFSERYIFASNIGFSLILANLFYWFWKKTRTMRIITLSSFVLMMIFFASLVFARSFDFKDNKTLYSATLRDNPRAYAIRYFFAVDLGMKDKNWDAAESNFLTIAEQNPKWADINRVYSNLGDIYRIKGNLDKALEYYKKSIESPRGINPYTFNNIGAIYVEKKENLRALINFCLALKIDPGSQKPMENFSKISSIIDSEYENNLSGLWKNVVDSGFYEIKNEDVIKYLGRDCENDQCSFEFLLVGNVNETILPFLILGASKNSYFKPEPSFDQNTRKIVLVSDLKYKKEAVVFIFPTCEGSYYKAKADLSN